MIFIAVGVLVIALAVAFFMFRGGEEATPAGGADGKGGAAAPTVTVAVPGRQAVDRTISATGTLAARRELPIGVAGEGGQVVLVLVEPGQWVGAGQVLAVIDRSVQTQANAQLAAQINVARADARLAQQELQRAQSLVARGFVSKADVERRTATRDAANARVRVAEAALAESRARSGSGVLFRMARGGEMELLAQLSESDLASIPVGSPAHVTPVGTDQRFTGSVWQVSPVINEQNRQGIARVALAYNPALRPGGFASVDIIAGTQQAPVLPESAILSDEKGNYVFLVDKTNKVVRRPVQTGAVTPAGIAVVQGLQGNERVVLRAGGFLNPGETVRPQRQAS
jgi:HlyD family secretion protein